MNKKKINKNMKIYLYLRKKIIKKKNKKTLLYKQNKKNIKKWKNNKTKNFSNATSQVVI
jgi:hypothetical protein